MEEHTLPWDERLLEDLDFTQQQLKRPRGDRMSADTQAGEQRTQRCSKLKNYERASIFHNDKQLSYLDVYLVIRAYIVSLICRCTNALSK